MVGLLIIATGKYIQFLDDLIKSADQYFLIDHEVIYYIFTDNLSIDIKSNRKINKIFIEHKPWPYSTLYRYKYFLDIKDELAKQQYLYYIDSDMIFKNTVGQEIFGNIVCVEHPWFPADRDWGRQFGTKGTPETNLLSSAYIPDNIDFQYKGNAFFGGKTPNILNMIQFLSNQIDIDHDNGIIAKYHDESHANKFYILYADKVLSPEYLYDYKAPKCIDNKLLIPRIVQVDKDEKNIRS